MEKRFYGVGQLKIECDDIEKLSQEACEDLDCGDIVVKVSSNGGKHLYQVAYKKATEMSLVYCDHENVEEVYYEKGDEGWAFVQTDITPIAQNE